MFERPPLSNETHPTEPLSDDSTFVLQWPEATREQVVEILVREHYVGLFRLAKAAVGEIVIGGEVARATIAEATLRRDEYQGQVSAKSWLYAMCIEQAKKRLPWHIRHSLAILPLLHQHEHLPLDEIAFILRTPPNRLAHQLDSLPAPENPPQPAEPLTSEQVHLIARAILKGEFSWPARGWGHSELAWLSLALIAVFSLFIRYRVSGFADDGQSLFPTPTSPPPPTPTAVSGIPLVEFTAPLDSRPYESSEPRISADGRFVAFASTDTTFGFPFPDEDTNRQQDIFVFDRDTFTFERVNISASGEQANGWSYAPDISADGRWLVFVSNASNLVEGDTGLCPPANSIDDNCFDIFLVDREDGTIRRISEGMYGWEAEGDSYLPSISANGRYIIYWSAAGNLSSRDGLMCLTNYGDQSCLDMFIYDRETDRTDFIFIGRSPDLSNWLQAPQISSDGRYVLLTVRENDSAAFLIPGIQYTEDLFIFDRQNETYTPVAHTLTGDPANAPALNASLAPDGRFVAFTTAASKLVPGDLNNRIDVFVLDLQTGTTERVSIASDGTEGNRHSGITRQTLGGLTDKISLSPDGRYVAFVSYADNLDDKPVLCTPPPTLLICNHLYLHDRQTAQTRLVASALGNINLIAYPSISEDGRLLTYLTELGECERACLGIRLTNLETEETWTISRADRSALAPPLPWSEQTLLTVFTANSTAFSPKGDLLAIGSNDGSIHIWDAARIWNTTRDPGLYTLEAHKSNVQKVVFSPNFGRLEDQPHGQYILASVDVEGKVLLWQVSASSGTWRFTLENHPGMIHDIAFSMDGKYLAVAHEQGIWLWELQPTYALLLHQWTIGQVTSLAFHPNDMLAAIHGDGYTWLLSVPGGETVARLDGHERLVTTAAWAPDGQILATGDREGRVNLWKITFSLGEAPEITLLKQLTHVRQVNGLSFSSDGNYLAAAIETNEIWVWNLVYNYPTQIVFSGRRTTANSVSFSMDGEWIAGVSAGGAVLLLDRPSPTSSVIPHTADEQPDWRYFAPLPYDEFPEQQILIVEEGQTFDVAFPSFRYSLDLQEFSQTGVYVRVPDVLLPEANFLGQVNYNSRIVGLFYDLPGSESQTVQLILYVRAGLGENPLHYADFPDYRIGLSAEVENVTIGAPENPIPAELVRGGWVYYLDHAPLTVSPEDQWVTIDWIVRWMGLPAWMTLRWESNNALFEITVTPKEGVEISEEALFLTQEYLLDLAMEIVTLDR